MELKDMANERLIREFARESYFISVGMYCLFDELLRRLDEADALRKENEALRKDKAKLLKDYAALRVNAALLVACDDALESLDSSEAKESEVSRE